MKRAAAIILSLTIVWLQVVASAQTTSVSGKSSRSCCRCHKACCVAPSAPDSQPLPAAPISSNAQTDFAALLPKLVVWLLPAAEAAIVSSSENSSASSFAVPLFQRDCALLI